MDSDSDSERQKSEYELLRERNIREMQAFLAEDDDDEAVSQAVSGINQLSEVLRPRPKPRPAKRTPRSGDAAFRYSGEIPSERRRSARLLHQSPQYSGDSNENDNPEENETPKKREYRPKAKRSRSTAPLAVIVPVEEITANQLANIAKNSAKKILSSDGTTCHQCRQKTLDTKTICRSGKCIGVRGYFCGPCLRNRYGESVREALLNPNWICPYCRDLCNCSFCQINRGEPPTGILAPVAFQQGYNSVSDMLQDLNGRGVIPRINNNVNVENGEPLDEEEEDEKPRNEAEEGEVLSNEGKDIQETDDIPKKGKNKEIEEWLLGFDGNGDYLMG